MSYNTELQIINTNLQTILNTVNTLPDKDNSGTTVQKWICTLEDGSTVEKYVEVTKICSIEYLADDDSISFSNQTAEITYGSSYITAISCSDSDLLFEVYVYMNGEEIFYDLSPHDPITVTIPSITGDVRIEVITFI